MRSSELARRVSGQPVHKILHRIAAPLGIADQLYFGVPPIEMSRLARLEDAVSPESTRPGPPSVLTPWER